MKNEECWWEEEAWNLDCRSHKMEAANKVERLASRIKVRERTSPPESWEKKSIEPGREFRNGTYVSKGCLAIFTPKDKSW